MTAVPPPSADEIHRFALRHGLHRLTTEQLARMAELAVYVAELGRTLPRPAHKSDPPAASPESLTAMKGADMRKA